MKEEMQQNDTVAKLAPISESARISSVDIIRGIALLGILLMNIVGMGLPEPAYSDPAVIGGDTGWNLHVFKINSLFFEGTMRGLFSVLFGAGVILFTSKKEADGAGLAMADAWYRRTIWLILFGMIHAYILLWPGDILYSYGMMGLLLFPFRRTKPKTLIIAASVFITIGMLWTFVEYDLAKELKFKAAEAQSIIDAGEIPTKELSKSLEDWTDLMDGWKPQGEKIAENIEAVQAGYFSAVMVKSEESFEMESYFAYRYDYYDILSMMLLGMALFRMGILHAIKSVRYYGLMVLLGYGIGLPINWFETILYIDSGYDVLTLFTISCTYDLGRISTMIGHIGLIMLFCKSGALMFLQNALSAVGRMALTNYIMHTVIATTVFVIFAQYGEWQRYQLYYLVAAIWIFQLIISPIWLRYFRFGPLEWIWRWLTYRKKPAMKRI